MRVITGSARGRTLESPAHWNVRPTSSKVKESIFSIVQFEVEGAQVLDLFAGTGQMGIEALSRGARECVFVENSRDSLGVLRKNLEATGPWKNASLSAADALAFLRGLRGESFDIAFLDPPYGAGLLAQCLELLAGKISPGGVVLCEADEQAALPEQFPPLALKKCYKHGKTRVFHYRVSDDS